MLAYKLDRIMKITNTKNSDLAGELGFDPSYISRIRAGKRGLPSRKPFIDPASRFFARRIKEGYQKRALSAELLEGREWPEDQGIVRLVIAAWFIDERYVRSDTITGLLDRASRTDDTERPAKADRSSEPMPPSGE